MLYEIFNITTSRFCFSAFIREKRLVHLGKVWSLKRKQVAIERLMYTCTNHMWSYPSKKLELEESQETHSVDGDCNRAASVIPPETDLLTSALLLQQEFWSHQWKCFTHVAISKSLSVVWANFYGEQIPLIFWLEKFRKMLWYPINRSLQFVNNKKYIIDLCMLEHFVILSVHGFG